jgi:hypothetical protein
MKKERKKKDTAKGNAAAMSRNHTVLELVVRNCVDIGITRYLKISK